MFEFPRILHFVACSLRCPCAPSHSHHVGADSLRVSTLAGSGSGAFANGVGSAASFWTALGVAVDASGMAYVADRLNNNRVRQIVLSTGAVTTLAGSGTPASTDGSGTSAAFFNPAYVALDGLGNLYVTDYGGHRIRKVVLATRAVTTVAGSSAGFADGVGTNAKFNGPSGIACDLNGNAYVADVSNNRIRKIVLSTAAVSLFAGAATPSTGAATPSATNGVGTNAGFSGPYNIIVDSSGALLFVAEIGNYLIRQIVIATQTVTTLAGSGAPGSANGVGIAAQFSNPRGLAVDASGNLFVADWDDHLIRRVVISTQAVTTVAGSGVNSHANGFGTNAAFNRPSGLAVDSRGNMLVGDYSNLRVRLMQPTAPCTPGYYCPTGSTSSTGSGTCAQGYYCPSGSSSATQVACPTGAFYCPAGASAPAPLVCAAGYDSVYFVYVTRYFWVVS
jgi:sugar lactone lactonase YvrE